MNFKDFLIRGPNRIEVRLYFPRADGALIRESVFLPKDGTKSTLLDTILYVWGNLPDSDEVSFMMAMDHNMCEIATNESLYKYVDSNKHLFGG